MSNELMEIYPVAYGIFYEECIRAIQDHVRTLEDIYSAIWHHDDKANIDSPFDEVLKDADVIDHCLTDPTKEIKEKERARYERLCQEFRLTEAAE